jgi:PAS domain S-box-containing protein
MLLKGTSIQRKLTRVILLTSGAVLLLTCTSFFSYELVTFRQTTVRQLSAIAEIIANNSTGALAFDSRDDANEVLASLKAERHIVAAGLYDIDGNLFAKYPSDVPANMFPNMPVEESYRFEHSHLLGFQPVMQGGKRLGTLYLKSNMEAMYERFQLYGGIVVLVIALSSLLAYLLSKHLQRGISKPILALAETAKAISDRGDYSVRAVKFGEDELGALTDAFNQMLTQIEEQNLEIISFNQKLEKKVIERTIELESNIIQLNESEEQLKEYQHFFNNSNDLCLIANVQGYFETVNPNLEKVLGYSEKEWVEKPFIEFVHPDDMASVIYEFQRQETEAAMVMNFICRFRKKESSYAWIEWNSIPNPVTGKIYAIGRDITERKNTEEHLQTVNKELESFSYSVSHDLRAPLRSIHSYINILYEEYAAQFDDEAKRLINIVIANSRKMGQLIDDLLAFSKLGRRQLMKTIVNMNSLVEAIWEEQVRLGERKNVELFLSDLPDESADLVTLTQVWRNLISNALKYSSHKDHATVEIGFVNKEGATVYFVRDNGAGFDMKYYHKLFGVFQRLHSSKEFDGTGVGLAIVQRIVFKHGGTIWAESKVQEGTTFYFSISGKISAD